MANDLRRQGIGGNDYPQYGTDFWGNSANNYGFGIRNIGQNVYTSKVNDKELKIVTSPIRRGNIVSSIYYPNK